MNARLDAAALFVNLFEAISRIVGKALALVDERVKQARRAYILYRDIYKCRVCGT